MDKPTKITDTVDWLRRGVARAETAAHDFATYDTRAIAHLMTHPTTECTQGKAYDADGLRWCVMCRQFHEKHAG